MRYVDFSCLRCGECCINHKFTYLVYNWKFGIYLSPKEAVLFPKETIVPMLGVGVPIKVTAYQVVTDRCPQLSSSGCAIYSNRPLACQTFPINSGKLSGCCKFVRTCKVGYEISKISIANEIAAELLMKEPDVPNDWIYPCNEKFWFAIPGGRYDRCKAV
jgi:Fe-S-cluster containining protein